MSRVRRQLRCADCGESPIVCEGRLVCKCPTFRWIPQKGVEGTAEDRQLLDRYGWRIARDPGGFVYWIGPRNEGVVTLYSDGTWSGGPEIFSNLDDYLKWFASGDPLPYPTEKKERAEP